MNYGKIYQSLIERASNRFLECYVERHHIIPKCIGGSNEKCNLVELLPEEHYIAHLLLVKIYPNEPKLIYAANMMANRNNKSYGWLKRKFAKQNSKNHTGLKHTDISKKKMSEKRKRVPKSEEHKNNIRNKKLKPLEYKGVQYLGYNDLKSKTRVTYHLYNKFYLNGIDPEPFIGNNTYAMIKTKKTAAKGKIWFNNGLEERYRDVCPEGWSKGRLSKKRNSNGKYLK